MRQVLKGIRVLDLTHVIAGPFASYQLALLGADVIKVEDPNNPDMARGMGVGGEHGMGSLFRAQGAGKRAITLDLKQEKDRHQLFQLLEGTDVLVENYRVGALSELGLGYKDIRDAVPKLIYCSLTGFGQSGAKAHQNAYDNVIQAASGLMSLNGDHTSWPLKIGTPVIDYATGLTAAYAIMTALFDRQQAGRGQHVDVSMLETAFSLMSANILGLTETNGHVERPEKNANGHPGLGCYQTADGKLMLGAMTKRQFSRLANCFEKPELSSRFQRLGHKTVNAEVCLYLEQVFLTKSAEVWEEILNRHGIPGQRVRTLQEALCEPHLTDRDALVETGHGRLPRSGFRLSNACIEATHLAPHLGQHNDEILAGMNDDNPASFTSKETSNVLSL